MKKELISLPSQAELLKLLEYEPTTGFLRWKPRSAETFTSLEKYPAESLASGWNKKWAGTLALHSTDGWGYRRGSINGQQFFAHRVVWKMAYGNDPDTIDHLNWDRTDNRLGNLKSVTISENGARKKPREAKLNVSPTAGLHFQKETGKWQAKLTISRGQRMYLGLFNTAEEARAARLREIRARFPHLVDDQLLQTCHP